jgi:hypothetical protein
MAEAKKGFHDVIDMDESTTFFVIPLRSFRSRWRLPVSEVLVMGEKSSDECSDIFRSVYWTRQVVDDESEHD